VVEHLTHYPKMEGSNPVTVTGTGSRSDIQHNNIQDNDSQHNDFQHNYRKMEHSMLILSAIMHSVCCAECHNQVHYAECRYAECHFDECRYAECHCAECRYAECHCAECRYAECHCAECRNTEWRGAEIKKSEKILATGTAIYWIMKDKITRTG